MRLLPVSLSILAICLLLSSCNKEQEQKNISSEGGASPEPAEYGYVKADTVKKIEDPKAGFFGHRLQNVYPEGEDNPIVFCDSGPSIPLHKPLTIFDDPIPSKPDATACKKIIAIVEGQGVWFQGHAMTIEEAEKIKFSQPRLIKQSFGYELGRLTSEWETAQPNGEPCQDVAGAPADYMRERKDSECSIAVVYSGVDSKYVLLLNWKVTGRPNEIGPSSPTLGEEVARIRQKFGDRYVLRKSR